MSFGSTGLEHRRKSAGDAESSPNVKDLFPFRRKKIAAEQHRAETDHHSLRTSPRRTCSAESLTPSRTSPQRAFSSGSHHSQRSSRERAAPERTSSGALHSLLHTPRKPRRTVSSDSGDAADTMTLMALQQALRSPRVSDETVAATPTSRELMRALRTPRRTCSTDSSRPKTPRSAGRSPRLATSFSPSSKGHFLDADHPRENNHSRKSASPSTRFRPRAVSPSHVRKITVQAIHSRHRRASNDPNDHQGVSPGRQQQQQHTKSSPRTPVEQPSTAKPATETTENPRAAATAAAAAATQLKSIPHLTSPVKTTTSTRRTACCDSPLAPPPDQPKRTSTCMDTTQEDDDSSSSSSSTQPPLDAPTAELCYSWYSRMGQPTREKMRNKVSTLQCGFTVDDVDRLPWKVVGGRTVLNVHAMNKLFL